MTDSIKITHFAGQPVPENGLTVHPPQGGELTVFQDGGYSFTPGSDSGFHGHECVATYYSFVMEDVDGASSVGTLSLNPDDAVVGSMHGFQAWSLPDLMEGSGGLDAFFSHDGGHHEAPGDAVAHVGHAAGLETHGFGSILDDDVTSILLAAQHV